MSASAWLPVAMGENVVTLTNFGSKTAERRRDKSAATGMCVPPAHLYPGLVGRHDYPKYFKGVHCVCGQVFMGWHACKCGHEHMFTTDGRKVRKKRRARKMTKKMRAAKRLLVV